MKNALRTRWFSVLTLVIFLISLVVTVEAKGGIDKDALIKKVSALQIPFIENQGQIKDKSVRFYATTFTGTVFITDKGEIVYNLMKSENRTQSTEDKSPLAPLY